MPSPADSSAPYCVLFSGQGTQRPGLCQDLWSLPVARGILERLEPLLGDDLEYATTEMPAEELALTYNAQRALHAHHLGHWFALRERRPDIEINGAIGHSVGVVAALVAAEAMSLEDSALFIRERARAFSEVCLSLERPTGLAAVSADCVEEVKELIQSQAGVDLALHNTAFKFVVGGKIENLERFALAARDRSMRVTLLKVQGAYHTAAFASCRDRLARALGGIPIAPPKIPVFMGTSGALENDPKRIRFLLAQQASRPELHFDAVRAAYAHGCRSFLEIASHCQALLWLPEQLIDEEGLQFPGVAAVGQRTEDLHGSGCLD